MIEHLRDKLAKEQAQHQVTKSLLKRSEDRLFKLREQLYSGELDLGIILQSGEELLSNVQCLINTLEIGKRRFERNLKHDLIDETKTLFVQREPR